MTLKDLLEKQWGVKTEIHFNPLVSEVATSKTQLLKPNPNRLAWTLINLGATAIYVAFTQDVANTKGVYVSATGGVFGLIWNEDFDLVTFPIYGIAVTAADAVYLVEVVAQ